MTQRARKNHRRSRGSVRRKLFVGLGILAAAVAIPVVGVGAWVLSVRADTPPLGQLKPVEEGSNSVVYAADGSRLGYIQSDTIRRPVRGPEDPQVLEHATVAIEDEHFYEHGGIDYGAIVRAGWEDLKAGAGRAGRLDDHPAARSQPLHRESRGDAGAKGPRGHLGGGATRRSTRSARSSPST